MTRKPVPAAALPRESSTSRRPAPVARVTSMAAPALALESRCISARRGRAVPLSPVIALIAALAIAACSSSPPMRFFALEALAPSGGVAAESALPDGQSSQSGLPLEVRSVRVPPTMDRVELIQQLPHGEVSVRDFAQWAAPLDRMARQVLTEDLALRLPPNRVVFPGAAGPDLRNALTVDILSFNVSGGSATMVASWNLRPPAAASTTSSPGTDSPIPTTKTASLRLVAPAAEGDAATARAWSDLMAQLADRIAKDLLTESK